MARTANAKVIFVPPSSTTGGEGFPSALQASLTTELGAASSLPAAPRHVPPVGAAAAVPRSVPAGAHP